MQLMLVHETTDFTAWKEAFDKDRDDRAHSGLRLLQVWKGDGIAAALFEVNNRAKAEDFLATQDRLLRERLGVTGHHHHFLTQV